MGREAACPQDRREPVVLQGQPGRRARRLVRTVRSTPGNCVPVRVHARRRGTRGDAAGERQPMITLPTLLLVLAADSGVNVIPRPAHLTPGSGAFVVTGATVIVTDRATRPLGELLGDYLYPAAGLRLAVRTAAPAGARVITLRLDPALTALGAEGYRLDVTLGRVTIRALQPAGVFYAIQTLRQLLPPAIFRQARVPTAVWTIPAVSMEDFPRFRWRGVHLDVARHFMPKEFVKKLVDLAALHKLNRLHLHLTDDQGWRIEIRQYPRLTQVGAWRRQTIIGRPDPDSTKWRFDGPPHGGLYTQDEIAEMVADARARVVTIVAESEEPGHSPAPVA